MLFDNGEDATEFHGHIRNNRPLLSSPARDSTATAAAKIALAAAPIAAAELVRTAKVEHTYVNINPRKVEHVPTMAFHAENDGGDVTLQLL